MPVAHNLVTAEVQGKQGVTCFRGVRIGVEAHRKRLGDGVDVGVVEGAVQQHAKPGHGVAVAAQSR